MMINITTILCLGMYELCNKAFRSNVKIVSLLASKWHGLSLHQNQRSWTSASPCLGQPRA